MDGKDAEQPVKNGIYEHGKGKEKDKKWAMPE